MSLYVVLSVCITALKGHKHCSALQSFLTSIILIYSVIISYSYGRDPAVMRIYPQVGLRTDRSLNNYFNHLLIYSSFCSILCPSSGKHGSSV